MKAEVVYQKMKEKVNKNYVNSNISLDRARAVYLFNEEQNKFVEWSLTKRNSYEIDDINRLLTTSTLKVNKSESRYVLYNFPKDFFSFVNINVKASKDECGIDNLNPVLVKPQDIEEMLADENNKPSFKYRETLYTLLHNGVAVYKEGFNLDSVKLTYYRYPKQFNIEGYIDVDGSSSYNSDPEFDDRIVDRIISACAKSFDINNENLNKIQFDTHRVVSKI